MTVKQARGEYENLVNNADQWFATCLPSVCLACMEFSLQLDAASISLDTATARAISGGDTPGAEPTWSQRWRTRQAAIWVVKAADREHKVLMAEVAW